MNILLLEDNFSDADLTTINLEKLIPDCHIFNATCINDARDLLQGGEKFDIALLDMRLPDGNGLDLLADIRNQNIEMATVVLTGSGDEEAAVAALEAGADDYIVKQGNYIEQLPDIINSAIISYQKQKKQKSKVIHVLYIEHHETDIDLTRQHLNRYAPYITLHAMHSGDEALDFLKAYNSKSTKIDVILMDFNLQGRNALELVKIIRQQLNIQIPIILVTGIGNEGIAVKAMKIGVNNYLSKSERYLFRLPTVILNADQKFQLEQQKIALIESEARYRFLTEHSADVIFTMDMNLDYTYVSPSIKNLRGYTQEEAMTQHLSEILTPESYEKALRIFSEVIPALTFPEAEESTQLLELEMIRKDGTTIWTEVKVKMIFDDENRPIGILGGSRDISKRKFVIDELRKRNQAIEQSPASVVITDTEGVIEYVNPKFIELTGYSRKELEGKTPSILKSGKTSLSVYKDLWETILEGKIWKGEFLNKRKDGSLYWESASISPIKDDSDKTTHFVAVKEDITEKKQMIDELILAKEKAEESNRLKTAFLANISHEIRTPLNGILGFSNLLQNQDLSAEKQQKFLSIVDKSGQRMLNTIQDIIQMSQIEAAHADIKISAVDVHKMIDYFYNFFQSEAANKGISFELTNHLAKEDSYIKTDKNKLESVLSNLLVNAIKFTSEGFVKFNIEKQDKMLIFTVEDSGIGIPSNRIEAIFNPFEQADLSLNRQHEGSGLGLSIARSYAEILGGEIDVNSELNSGSTFTFSMPCIVQKGIKEDSPLLDSQEDPILEPKGQNQLILVVEDEDTNFSYIKELMKPHSFRILHALTGEQAIEMFNENTDIKLVLMDIRLPGKNGHEVTRIITKLRPEVPVIAQTAFAQDRDRELALASGCVDFISKPFTAEELLNKIHTHIIKEG